VSLIERDYATARDLIRKAEAAGVYDDDDDRHALRDAVKRLHGAAIANARAVEALRWALGFIEYQGKPSPWDDPREGEADAESYRRALAIVGGQ
jgi:hypothetical protein